LTVLDAYAVIAYLRAEPAASQVRRLLGTGAAVLTAVGVAEVLDHLVRVVGAHEEDATLDLAELGLLEGTLVDSAIGAAAGRLRARYYDRSKAEPLATSDPHLLDLCHAEGIATVVLPGSDGSRWVTPG
jgi:PIN domain nuclease of toxin-antitoxin system